MSILDSILGIIDYAVNADGEQLTTTANKKRNLSKEAQWQKEKYKKFGFTIDKTQGEQFIQILADKGITPLEWFKSQVTAAINGNDVINHGTENTANDTTPAKDIVQSDTTVSSAKPPITDNVVQTWQILADSGLSYAAIAKSHDGLGYDSSTISRRIAKLRNRGDN